MTAALWITWGLIGFILVLLSWLVHYIGVLNSDQARLARCFATMFPEGQVPPELAELIADQQRRGGGR